MADWLVIAALLQFHLRSGLRVAMRALVPLVVALTAAVVLQGSPLVIIAITRAIFLPAEPAIAAALLEALTLISLTMASAPRLTRGLGGWIRHLPASGAAQRRAACAGLALTEVPILLLVLVTCVAVPAGSLQVTLLRCAGLPVLAWASALAALPIRPYARLGAAAAALAAALGTWWALPASLVLLVVCETGAGSIRSSRLRQRRRWVRRAARSRAAAPGGNRLMGALRLWFMVAGRAIGWRLLATWLLVVPVLVPALLFLANNSIDTARRAGVLRLAGLLAAVAVTTSLCETLVKRRPPWPWIRSLPWSSTLRAGLDGALLLILTLPVVLPFAPLSPVASLPILAVLPWLALRGAAAIREGPARTSGAAGQLLTEAVIPVALVTLLPWTALVVLLAAPLALRQAARAEQHQDVSRWHELHHLAAGDSLEWSDS